MTKRSRVAAAQSPVSDDPAANGEAVRHLMRQAREKGILAITDPDRSDPFLDIALNKARPWRTLARTAGHYRARQVDDQRSSDHTRF